MPQYYLFQVTKDGMSLFENISLIEAEDTQQAIEKAYNRIRQHKTDTNECTGLDKFAVAPVNQFAHFRTTPE